MGKLKYSREQYETCDYYGGDMDCDIDVISKKLVKCRKPHKCMGGCGKTIEVGQYALCEKGFEENWPVSCYTCINCLNDWLDEIETETETETEDI